MKKMIALCGIGGERVVSNELKKLGLRILNTGFGRVRFEADIRGIYRALMGLRAADRILLEAARFPAEDFDALFDGIDAVPWEDYIPHGAGLRVVKVRNGGSKLRGITSIQAVAHKAAANRLCKSWRVERLTREGFQAEIRIYIEKDQVSVLLDLSGEALFKRGYRTEGGTAPLRETTAAAILLLANWRRKFPLYDPFCGSGTVAIEAAMYAWDMAPGLGRSFALSQLRIGDAGIEAVVRQEFLGQINFDRTIRISGSDADTRAVALARSNVQRACELAQGKQPEGGIRREFKPPWLPDFRVIPIKTAGIDRARQEAAGDRGFIITNPPYGKRLGDVETAEATYAEMAVLSKNFPGWKLGVITDHIGFESHFGRKADFCRKLTNGAIDSFFYEYETL
jgi:putative N6-adenine-specific DNA methylase